MERSGQPQDFPLKDGGGGQDSGCATKGDSSVGSIQVVVRLRPMNDTEKRHGTLPVVTTSTKDRTVTVIKDKNSRKPRLTYAFDNVFTAFSTMDELFGQTLLPMFEDVLQGYESTVFAYGQTGTGKTYTMEGDLSNDEMHGVIPRTARAIFDALDDTERFSDYRVMCSFLEIYNEELMDLLVTTEGVSGGGGSHHSTSDACSALTPKLRGGGHYSSHDSIGGSRGLDIMEGKSGPFCRGLSEKEVKSSSDVLELMRTAQEHRRIGETSMNKLSNRSHCIFTMKIRAQSSLENGSGSMEFNGKLHMVDLAGSEFLE